MKRQISLRTCIELIILTAILFSSVVYVVAESTFTVNYDYFYYENQYYQLLCAITDPDLVNYVYSGSAYTATEKIFIFAGDYLDVAATAVHPYLNLPASSLWNLGYPVGIVLDTDESVSFYGGSGGIMYVTQAAINSIENAKALWFRRLNYLSTTVPTRYKVIHTSAKQEIQTTVTVTGKAIVGMVSYSCILGGDLYLNSGGTWKNMYAMAGASYHNTTYWDYGYISRVPLIPLKLVTSYTWVFKSYSASSYSANACVLYFEVYDDLPSWWGG